MNQLMQLAALSMPIFEIAELVNAKYEEIRQEIEQLEPPVTHQHLPADDGASFNCCLNKQDSIRFIAQNYPEYTGKIVNHWKELENSVTQAPSTTVRAMR